MEKFRVTNVVDGDTFDVPKWTWNGNEGTRVRPTGYDTPEMGTIAGAAAKRKLTRLIHGKQVVLGAAHTVDRGRLVCEVYFNGRNLAAYFPEFQ